MSVEDSGTPEKIIRRRRKLLVGNWKMNGSLADIAAFTQTILTGPKYDSEIVICPPFIYIPELAIKFEGSNLLLGAQNVSHQQKGAFTGEIAVTMLQDYDCRYVIVGHSERRQFYCETDLDIAKKFITAGQANVQPILCVGESLQERMANDTKEVIARQLDAVLETAAIEAFEKAVIAYEPIWAIGTGKTATPDQAQEVHAFIRSRLAHYNHSLANNIRILYGGSIKSSNAEQLFAMPDIDGGLIGGASLIADEFLAIYHAASILAPDTTY